jgi:hypothetical protein
MSNFIIDDEVRSKAVGIISRHNRDKLDSLVQTMRIPISRLVAIAIAKEFERGEDAFKYEYDLPDDEYVEHTFINEASKILVYMKKIAGMSMQDLFLVRHDIGIPDGLTFRYAFRELVLQKMVETYKPKQSINSHFKYDDDVVFYRVKGSGEKAAREQRIKLKQLDKFNRLKKDLTKRGLIKD